MAIGMACSGSPPPDPSPAPVIDTLPAAPPEPASQWPAILASAIRAADAGRYEDADRILLTHSLGHRGKAEGMESDFWRALLRADPANGASGTRDAMSLLDAYIAAGPGAPRYVEAVMTRRFVATLDSARAAAVTARSSSDARDRAREEEIRRLTEELEKTAAELDRIKRRLAPERKTPAR
jgi:hypothetical protein